MNSILLITTTPHQSLETHTQALPNHPDTLWIEANPITIELIRSTHRFAATPPLLVSQKHLVIIDAHHAKIEAQNALLKLLEEPPAYLTIILTTHSTQSLLPTVLSRCQKIYDSVHHAKKSPHPDTIQLITRLSNATLAQRFLSAAIYSKKESALEIVNELATYYESHLLHQPLAQNALNLRLIQQAADYLNQNVNPQAVLEQLLSSLDYPHT